MWTWSTGLGIAAASGHASAPIRWALSQRRIRRAWVSGDPWAWVRGGPAGIESEAGRRALSQRRAGGHWVSGDPVAWSPANGAPGGAATRELGNLISRDRRAWGLMASGLAALAAIPPNSHALLQWAKAGGRVATSLPRDRHKQTATNKNYSKNEQNKTGWKGAAYG